MEIIVKCKNCSYEPTLKEALREDKNCPRCGTSAATESHTASGAHAHTGKKAIAFALVILTVLGLGGKYAIDLYNSHQENEARTKVITLLKSSKEHVARQIEISKSGATYQEYFDYADEGFKEISKNIADLSRIDVNILPKDEVTLARDCMLAEAAILRKMSLYKRSLLKTSSQLKLVESSKSSSGSNIFLDKVISAVAAQSDSEKALKELLSAKNNLGIVSYLTSKKFGDDAILTDDLIALTVN
jgi:hypothetical protein